MSRLKILIHVSHFRYYFSIVSECKNSNATAPLPALSTEELALRALEHLPRDRVMDGIGAFNEMKCVSFICPQCPFAYAIFTPIRI